MVCIGVLAAIVVLAFVTPLLPLQPPDKIATARKFEPPAGFASVGKVVWFCDADERIDGNG